MGGFLDSLFMLAVWVCCWLWVAISLLGIRSDMIINSDKPVPLIGGGFVGGNYWRGLKWNRDNLPNAVSSNIPFGYKAVVRLLWQAPRRAKRFATIVLFETVYRPIGNNGDVEPWYHRWVETIF